MPRACRGCWRTASACGTCWARASAGQPRRQHPQRRGQRFARLRELCPRLEVVGFNGQASGKFAPQFEAAGYRARVLPSTSPAHASLSFEQKLAQWRQLKG